MGRGVSELFGVDKGLGLGDRSQLFHRGTDQQLFGND